MELTADNVRKTINACLHTGDHPKEENSLKVFIDYLDKSVMGRGIKNIFMFNKEKVKEKEADIISMLDQLPDGFKRSKGGGWAFVNLCMNNKDEQWCDLHDTMDELVALGVAIERVKFMGGIDTKLMAGGLPYVMYIDTPPEKKRTFEEAAKLCADWWVDKTFRQTYNQSAGLDPETFIAQNELSMKAQEGTSEKTIEEFRGTMIKTLCFRKGYDWRDTELAMDYGPNDLLMTIGAGVGMSAACLPVKTSSWINEDNTIYARFGYQSEQEKI